MKLDDIKTYGRKTGDLSAHFLSKVDTSGECYEWLAARDKDGYGRTGIWLKNGEYKNMRANRLAWILTHGELSDDLFVCHTCDNPSCVRPEHLFLGTIRDNAQDSLKKGRTVGGQNFKGADKKGELNVNAKLTWNYVKEIRKASAMGLTQRALTRIYVVGAHAVSDAVNNHTWVV
jgi:hypothetical protein